MGLLAPLSRGNITIRSSDMLDSPVIDPAWLTTATDREVAVAAFKRARQLFATDAMKAVTIGEESFPGPTVQTDAQILAAIHQSVETLYHASSTCAMGQTDDPNAVVDSKARVIGVSGLRVVDASAFPFLPPGQPQVSAFAVPLDAA